MAVKLIPFSQDHLRVNASLPFDIVDPAGNLLMPKGAVIASSAQLQALCAHTLMVDEEQTDEWRREYVGKLDSMVRQNVRLKTIAAVSSEGYGTGRSTSGAPTVSTLSVADEVDSQQSVLAALLRETSPEGAWFSRIDYFIGRMQALIERDTDRFLYLLVQTCTQTLEHYTSHHALLVAVVVRLCAQQLHWAEDESRSLVRAALTMNISMSALQNTLAMQDWAPTADQRRRIDSHAQDSAALLAAAGFEDQLCIDVVRQHHSGAIVTAPLETLAPPERLAQVLQRVDVFTAKISPRKRRAGMPAPLAARDACLGPDGRPDMLGAALLKMLGIYPPGSYVSLANGEMGVVMQRGRRANQPRVASIVGRDGLPIGSPPMRDTVDPRFEVKGAVRSSDIRVRVSHERLLALR